MNATKRKNVVRAVIVAVIVMVLIGGWMLCCALKAVEDSYEVWWVAESVVEYLKANDNRWPKSWNDLREPSQKCRAVKTCPFDELRLRVDVDWTANTEVLAKESSFRVIWLKDGSNAHWELREPNAIVGEYLRAAFENDHNREKSNQLEDGIKQ
jgi:hypothetical protein